jgi:tyrosyl-tRNA synthetase
MKMLTFIPIEEIEEIEKTAEGAALNIQKTRLAYELTKMVHGDEEAEKAKAAAEAIFSGGADINSADMPQTVIPSENITDGKVGVLDALALSGLAPSKSEARRLIQGGGVTADGEKITDPAAMLDLTNPVIIKKGKKIFHKILK